MVRIAPFGVLLLLACAHPGLHLADGSGVGQAERFALRYGPEDAAAAAQVLQALESALPIATRWGSLDEPVLITIHPDHQALEEAVHQAGRGWMRAWSRARSIDLQSPRTWSTGSASEEQLVMLFAHELSHCILYQAAAHTADGGRHIPIWFREGMGVAAEDMALAQEEYGAVGRSYRVSGGAGEPDPITQAALLLGSHPELVYQASADAFRTLVERHGEGAIRALVARLARGEGFAEAFQVQMGRSVGEFERSFTTYAALVDRHG